MKIMTRKTAKNPKTYYKGLDGVSQKLLIAKKVVLNSLHKTIFTNNSMF